jgi:hypothetical protein
MQFIEYYLASTVTECNLTNDHLFSILVSATTGPYWDGPSFSIILSMLMKACNNAPTSHLPVPIYI